MNSRIDCSGRYFRRMSKTALSITLPFKWMIVFRPILLSWIEWIPRSRPMFVRLDKKVSIARLFTFLGYGERMAHNCAKAQAALADDPETPRFLTSQARR